MQRLLITFVIMCLTTSMSLAQTEQGSWLIGGSLNISTSGGKTETEQGNQTVTNQDNNRFTFGLNPDAGYFLADNFALGLGAGFELTSVGNPDNDDFARRQSTFKVAPFGRYYAPLGDKASFFGQAQLDLAFGSSETENSGPAGGTVTTEGPSTTEINANIQPGFSVFLGDKAALNFYVPAILGYQYQSVVDENPSSGADKETEIDADFGFNFDLTSARIGANFFF